MLDSSNLFEVEGLRARYMLSVLLKVWMLSNWSVKAKEISIPQRVASSLAFFISPIFRLQKVT